MKKAKITHVDFAVGVNIAELEISINSLIEVGYQPRGAVFITAYGGSTIPALIQQMVRR